ncbi:hypothetical protein [Amycolatopsis sp. NPDC003731]
MTHDPALPAKLAAHPSVRAVLSRRPADPPPVLDAARLRELCLAAGADDVAVSLDHPDLAGEREYVLGALPGTRTLIAMAFRMNRDNCRSPARSVADQEFHQTGEQANHTARSVVQARTGRSTRRSASRRRWTASARTGSGWWRTRRSRSRPGSG